MSAVTDSCDSCGDPIPDGDGCDHDGRFCAACFIERCPECRADIRDDLAAESRRGGLPVTTTEAPAIEPGVYPDIKAEDYHAGAGISASGLKRLLPPYTPAHYRYGEPFTSAALDFGKVAHRLVLGDGDSFTVSPFESFRTKEAKDWKAEREAAGVVVISADDLQRARQMAAAVKRHPWAGKLFEDGKPEQSLYWTDPETGVLCRARYDWLRNIAEGRRLLIPDYETARSINPDTFGKSSADYGYYISAALYIEGAKALGLDPDPAFLLVAQEKTAPYLVNVFEFTEDDLQLGRALVRKGLRLYADCLASDTWPGYSDSVIALELPTWHRITTEEYVSDYI